jgi:hypothetical protein
MRGMIRAPKELTRAMEAALDAAYQQGWKDATAAMIEVASGKLPLPATSAKIAAQEPAKRAHSARDVVILALTEEPIMQPMDIFRWSEGRDFCVTFEAIRTAIKRMNGTEVERASKGKGYSLRTRAKQVA